MILFWMSCTILVALALVFVLPPLFYVAPGARTESPADANAVIYRTELAEIETALHHGSVSREQYELDRQELEWRLLEDVSLNQPRTAKTKQAVASHKLGYTLAIALPLVAFLMYTELGGQRAFSTTNDRAVGSGDSPLALPGTVSPEHVEKNVRALAKRLEQNPNDPKAWIMLARSYNALERYKEASDAFQKATALVSNDPDLLIEYAFALSRTAGRMKGKPADLIQRALRLNPDNPSALALAGNAAFEDNDYYLSILYWQRLLRSIPADSDLARPLNDRIAEARALAKMNDRK